MAQRPREGWEMNHNKHPVSGASMKDLRHRRQRRGLREALRAMVNGVPSPEVRVPRGASGGTGQMTSL